MSGDLAYNNHLAHSVKRLYHLMSQVFNDVLRPYGVAQSQWYILYDIQHSEGLTQIELQRRLQIESATLTPSLNALEKKGWLLRQPGPTDHRVKGLCLTPAGRDLWESLPDPIQAVRQRMLNGISPEEEEISRRILDKAIQNLEE